MARRGFDPRARPKLFMPADRGVRYRAGDRRRRGLATDLPGGAGPGDAIDGPVGQPAPEALSGAVADLSRAVGALAEYLEEPGRSPQTTRRLALEAARDANALLEERNDLAIAALVAQIRSKTVDIVRGTCMDYQEALAALEQAVASSPQEPADAPRSPDPSQEPQ